MKKIECLVGIGTVLNTNPKTQDPRGYTTGSLYTIIHIDATTVRISSGNISIDKINELTLGELPYTIQKMNEILHTRQFTVFNTTPEIEEKLGVFTNVVQKEKFELTLDSKFNKYLSPSHVFKLQTGSSGNCRNVVIHPGGTHNCQLTIIGDMIGLLTWSTDVLSQLEIIRKKSGRDLLLCDIKTSQISLLEKKLGEKSVISKMDYLSTNGSKMTICIINLKKIHG